MFESLVPGLHLVLSTFALAATPHFFTVGAAGLTVALVSATVIVAALLATALPDAGSSTPPHPTRAIDVSSELSQSDPDASGHARPRAPGYAASAA